jgi:hypothetical protein
MDFRADRGPTPEEAAAAYRDLVALLDRHDIAAARHDKIAGVQAKANSMIASDDALTEPYSLSHAVQFALLLAHDNLMALSTLMRSAGEGITLPILALYPHLRVTIESSALALWLMGGPHQRARIVRLLQEKQDEQAEDHRLMLAVLATQATDNAERRRERARMRQEHAKTVKAGRRDLVAIARRNQIDMAEVDKQFPNWRTLIAEGASTSSFKSNPTFIANIWSFVSGLTHPSVSRALFATSLEQVGDATGDTYNAIMSSNPRSLVVPFIVGLQLFENRVETFADGKIRVAAR